MYHHLCITPRAALCGLVGVASGVVATIVLALAIDRLRGIPMAEGTGPETGAIVDEPGEASEDNPGFFAPPR